MIYAGDNLIQLTLGPPPLSLYENWIKDRVEFYEKMEPLASPSNDTPVVPLNKNCKRIAITGPESELVWGVIMGPTDHSLVVSFWDEVGLDIVGAREGDRAMVPNTPPPERLVRRRMAQNNSYLPS